MSARVLLVDTVYQDFVKSLYTQTPDLAEQSYAHQLEAVHQTCYHNTTTWGDPLRRLGFDVHESWANHMPLQRAWCRENGQSGLVPEFEEAPVTSIFDQLQKRKNWFLPVVAAQVRAVDPDIIWLGNLYAFDSAFLREVKGRFRFAVGQNAAMPPKTDLTDFNLLVSASMENVNFFRSEGLTAEYVPHGFNSRILSGLAEVGGEPESDVAFFGNFYPTHQHRLEFFLSLGRHLEVEVWTSRKLPQEFRGSKIKQRPALWGMEMYRQIQRTRVVINVHMDGTGDWATNQRLYEVTGVGSVLVTDTKSNLPVLFNVGSEILSFESTDECVEKIQHLLADSEWRRGMAARGRRRTLTEHTCFDRALLIRDVLKQRLLR